MATLEELVKSTKELGRQASESHSCDELGSFGRNLHSAFGALKVLQDPNLACSKGCSFCCHRPIQATFPEILAAATVVKSWPAETKQAFAERVRTFSGIQQERLSENQRLDSPCPFLVNNQCEIYDARPMMCRGVNSYSQDACKKVFIEGGTLERPHNPEKEDAAQQISLATMVAVAQGKSLSGWLEFAPAVLEAVETSPQTIPQPNTMNRHKVVSEFLRSEPAYPPIVEDFRRNPSVQAVIAGFTSGSRERLDATLAPHRGSAFEKLFSMMMPFSFESQSELDEHWDVLLSRVSEFSKSDLPSDQVLLMLQDFNTFSWSYCGKDVRPPLERLGQTLRRHAETIAPAWCEPLSDVRKPGKTRIGYISHRVMNFNGSRWALPWVQGHSSEIETHVINLCESEDVVSQLFRRVAEYYHHLPFTLFEIIPYVRDLDLDALIWTDIGMSGISIQLSSFNLARRTMTSWGHPVTSGCPVVTEYLSSDWMEPENSEGHYTENLVRLPGAGFSVPKLPFAASEKSAAELELPHEPFFFCPQILLKITPSDDVLLAQLSQHRGYPIVFLPSQVGDGQRTLDRLRRAGVRVAVTPYKSAPDFRRALQLSAGVADLPMWNGANTTVDALSQGVPVVSMPGPYMRSRHGLAFLRAGGVEGLNVGSPKEYVELLHDPEAMRGHMKGLNLEAIYQGPDSVSAIEALLQG